MAQNFVIELVVFFSLLIACSYPLGVYIGQLLSGPTYHPPGMFLENAVYKICGIDVREEMDWRAYTRAVLYFNGSGLLFLFVLQLVQHKLPFNPQSLPTVEPWLAFNTAVSFVTNTNWQSYSGEVTLSYLTQALGLGVQNFVSAATGIAVMAALARGLRNKTKTNLGNFWFDLTRVTLFVLLPLAAIWTIVLISQGVIQNWLPYIQATTVEGTKQVLPMGPAASQIAIKQLGTNGGGFFGVNSTHPFENPTPFANFMECLALLLIPAALPFTFGRLVGRLRHAKALFAAMAIMLVGFLALSLLSETQGNVLLNYLPFWEGKEFRLGINPSILWSIATTASSNGSVNAMHSSLSPLSGGIAMLQMMLGEVVFGGVGSGMYGMVLFVILTVFIAGLMVGRSPEYLGKKIEAKEVKLALVGILAPNIVILAFSAVAAIIPMGLSSLSATGPHGLSEILYNFSSAAGNNGSAFAGMNANTPFYNGMIALGMLVGRFAIIIPVLAIAGSLGEKKRTPPSSGTFATEGGLFTALLVSIILIVSALTFFPTLSLGPIMEFLLAHNSVTSL